MSVTLFLLFEFLGRNVKKHFGRFLVLSTLICLNFETEQTIEISLKKIFSHNFCTINQICATLSLLHHISYQVQGNPFSQNPKTFEKLPSTHYKCLTTSSCYQFSSENSNFLNEKILRKSK